jgi:hypothetical protein
MAASSVGRNWVAVSQVIA